MIKHVVMWKLRGPSAAERAQQTLRVRDALHALRGRIPGLRTLEVGIGEPGDEQHADVVLITTHDDWDAVKAYQVHPEHLIAAGVIGELRVERRVLDFEIA